MYISVATDSCMRYFINQGDGFSCPFPMYLCDNMVVRSPNARGCFTRMMKAPKSTLNRVVFQLMFDPNFEITRMDTHDYVAFSTLCNVNGYIYNKKTGGFMPCKET